MCPRIFGLVLSRLAHVHLGPEECALYVLLLGMAQSFVVFFFTPE